MISLKINHKPLSVNRVWQGKRFKTKEYQAYEDSILWELPREKISGLVEVHYRFYLIHYGRTDTDNLVKPIQDILVKGGIIDDDRQIIRFTAEKIKSKIDYIEIKLKPYGKTKVENRKAKGKRVKRI